MSALLDKNSTDLSPEMKAAIEALVDARVKERLAELDGRIEDAALTDRVTMVVFSGDFDRLFASMIIATGAVAMGMEVSMFFTFWGLMALKNKTIYKGKSFSEKMVTMMMPKDIQDVGTSKLNMMGMGPKFFRSLMTKHGVETLPGLFELARDMGVKMIACQMSMGIMGVTKDELFKDLEYGGVATYLGDAGDSKVTLFI